MFDELLLSNTDMIITEEDLKHLKLVRNYFGEHDKTLFEHRAYAILDSLLTKLEQLTKHCVMQAEDPATSDGASAGQPSVGTATCGVDDNSWNCKMATETGGVASQCMNGCVLET
jgi:hypothetical protein